MPFDNFQSAAAEALVGKDMFDGQAHPPSTATVDPDTKVRAAVETGICAVGSGPEDLMRRENLLLECPPWPRPHSGCEKNDKVIDILGMGKALTVQGQSRTTVFDEATSG